MAARLGIKFESISICAAILLHARITLAAAFTLSGPLWAGFVVRVGLANIPVPARASGERFLLELATDVQIFDQNFFITTIVQHTTKTLQEA